MPPDLLERPQALKYYSGALASLAGVSGFVSRTGYTGEDGCEWIVPAERAMECWEKLVDSGRSLGLIAAGLGARDTLRLEAAMPLYGHELNEDTHPLQAGLQFAVKLEGRDFPGVDVLRTAEQQGGYPKLIGLKCPGRRVPREGYPVLSAGEPVGVVTSGTFSPTLQQPIALAYVAPSAAGPWAIDIRGKSEAAELTALPFYRRAKA